MVKTKLHYGVICLILLVAFVVRINVLSEPRDFWHDEAFQYLYSEKPVSFILDSNDVHPPLFNLFTKLLLTIGFKSIFWLRFIMVIISLFAIWAFYLMLKENFDEKTTILATILFSLAPTYVFYSTEFRNYTFVILFTILQILFFNRLLKDFSFKNKIFYLFFSLIMVYSHYLAGLVILAQMVYVHLKDKTRNDYLYGVYLPMAVFCSPLLIYLFKTLPKIQSFWFKDINLVSFISTFVYIIIPPIDKIIGISVFLYSILFLFLIYFRKKLDHRHFQFALYLFLPVVVMWTISQFYPFFHHRYFLFGGIGLFVLVGNGMFLLGKKVKDLEIFLICIFIILSMFGVGWMAKGFDTEILDSTNAVYNYTNNGTEQPFITLHTSTFSQSSYKVLLPDNFHCLDTNLTTGNLFTAGGSVINDYERNYCLWLIKTINVPVFFVSDKKVDGEIIFSEGGLYVTKIN